MWKRWCVFVCLLGIVVLAVSALAADDPSTLPLIQFADLIYLGAFRLPDTFVNGDGFTIGGRPVAFNPARNSLFIGSRAGHIAEMTIPTPVNSATITSLPFASFLQGFADPTEGNLWQVASDGASIDGIMVQGDKLYGTASIYYDANNTQIVSHYSRSTDLSRPSFQGMSQVWESQMAGFVSGYMANVPAEWQPKLGGPAITGQCCLPIAWRTSWGPSAFAWNPQNIGVVNPVPAIPLLYYPHDHHTLGHWDGSNPVYGGTAQINGVVLVAGTRTALFFGRNGLGPFCYGNGTSVQSLVGTIGPDNEIYCYDPSAPAKGQHAYPYQYQIWAYDLNDLAAVKAGSKQPWDVVPYGVWPFTLPTPEPTVRIGGVGYDASRQIIYVSQLLADQDGYGYRPIIHALHLGAVSGTTVVPPPPPPPTSRTSAVAIAADKAAPQAPGSTITWTATPTGGVAPHEYKWWTYDGASWLAVGGWTTDNRFAWRPAIANNADRVAVWVRSAGNTIDDQETSVAVSYPISGAAAPPPPPPPTTRATAVTLTANRAAPQPPATTITWSASPVGGVAPYQYKWWTFDGAGWTPVSAWTTLNTFAWSPTTANANYRVAVWVRSAGNSVDDQETSTAVSFAISGSASVTQSSTSSSTVSAVTLTADKSAPQPIGTTITVNATPTAGVAPQQYKWWIFDGSSWTVARDWSQSNTFAWTPASVNPLFRLAAWVRSAGSAIDAPEAKSDLAFATTSSTTMTTQTDTTSSRATAVSLSVNKIAPQPPGSTITWTATPTGGVAPQQYKFYLWDSTTWLVVRGWGTANTFTWTPSTANQYYKMAVWVRSATNTVDDFEASTSVPFAIINGSVSTSTSNTRVSGVTISSNLSAPQAPGVTALFSALATDGTGALQYKWWIYDGTAWVVSGGWTSSNVFAWTPAAKNPNFKIGVWVKSGTNTVDEQESSTSIAFPIQ